MAVATRVVMANVSLCCCGSSGASPRQDPNLRKIDRDIDRAARTMMMRTSLVFNVKTTAMAIHSTERMLAMAIEKRSTERMISSSKRWRGRWFTDERRADIRPTRIILESASKDRLASGSGVGPCSGWIAPRTFSFVSAPLARAFSFEVAGRETEPLPIGLSFRVQGSFHLRRQQGGGSVFKERSTLRQRSSSGYPHQQGVTCLSTSAAEGADMTVLEGEEQAVENSVIFSTPGCPFCRRARSTLKDNGVAFEEIDVSVSTDLWQKLIDVTGRRSVPVIFLNGRYIGGSDELDKLVETRDLDKIMKESRHELPVKVQRVLKEITSASAEREKARVDVSQSLDVQTRDYANDDRSSSQTGVKRYYKLEELASLMADRGEGLKTRGSFTGAEACQWLISHCIDVCDVEAAVTKGRALQEAHFLNHVTFSEPFSASEKECFRLITQEDEPSLSNALNAKRTWVKPTRSAVEVAGELRRRVFSLYEEALSEDGRSVNYKSLAKSETFKKYVEATGELQRVDLFSLGRNEKMAFFINVYNSLVIHSLVENGAPNSFFKRNAFFRGMKYCIGGNEFSLDDIENGVLRANRSPTARLIKKPPFGSNDPRRFHCLPPIDPRIHFALVCGAKSCPPIKLYTPTNLEEGLESAAAAFCEGEAVIDLEKRTITLSKIFDWYKDDFGRNPKERLEYISRFFSAAKRSELNELLGEEGSFSIQYSEYNWDLNE